jgi:eukaryotic-like serine/threonine-protein kinase
MIATWNRWEGVYVAGEYGLDEWLGESDNAAFFRTSYGPDQRPAVAKVIPAEAASTDSQLELWRELREISHPALLQLLDFGVCTADGSAAAASTGDLYLYAVYEFPEETLDAALSRAPLEESEKREIREAATGALRYLHAHGFVHGAIDAGHVVAAGNAIKLSSDTVRRVSDEHTPAEDWRKLELLLPETTVKAAVEPAPAPSAPLLELPSPPRFALPTWAIGTIAAMLCVGGFWFLPKSAPPAHQSEPQSNPAPVAAVKALPPPTQPQAPAEEHREWRVIVYTYSNYQAASHKAAAITEKWPGALAEVFRPKSAGRSPYLVALGGWMTRDDAVRLLKIARGKGMPRDTYIQNYTR